MRPGTKVKMSEALKKALTNNGSSEHVEEFGNCIGIVLGPVDYGNGVLGPDIDVSWLPDNLKYGYQTKWLVNINPLSDKRKKLILSEDNSKPNKLWFAIAWWWEGYYIDWRWQGVERYSRLQFRFSEDGEWLTAKSHEEDVMPKMKFVVNKKKKEDGKKEK